jgi:hypothetical protein
MNKQELINLLEKNEICTSEWGTGDAKTLGHLLKEITNDEAILKEVDGILVRKISVVSITVFFQKTNPTTQETTTYKLIEKEQIFKDGRRRTRGSSWSIAEKIKIDELPADALTRALKEELGIVGNPDYISDIQVTTKLGDSTSYPGLMTISEIHEVSVHLNTQQYNPNGYIEEQGDKTTYFKWI